MGCSRSSRSATASNATALRGRGGVPGFLACGVAFATQLDPVVGLRDGLSRPHEVALDATTTVKSVRTHHARLVPTPPLRGASTFAHPRPSRGRLAARPPLTPCSSVNNAFVAPRRNGSHNVFMSERELERAYRVRFRTRTDRKESLAWLCQEIAINPQAGVSRLRGLAEGPGTQLRRRQ